MIENLINTQFIPLLLLATLGLFILIQLLFYWLLFNRLGAKKVKPGKPGHDNVQKPVSVVICAHNEYHNLKDNLPLILQQDYPIFEVLVVNHASDDDTPYLLRSLQEQYSHLNVVTITEDLNFFTGKKFPLSIGIKSAKYDLVLLTDADCRPVSGNWISRMQSAFVPGREIVLGYSPYNRYRGFLNKLIRFDTMHIAIQYLTYAERGFPYMGVGRNLAYRKQLFYKHNGFIAHYRIRSGDDDLFINRVARGSNTAVMIHPDSYTLTEPCKTFGKWITQKRRHLSTGLLYKTRHRFLLGIYTLSSISVYLLSILLVSLQWSLIPVLSLFVLRLVSQYFVFSRGARRLNEVDLAPFVPVFELIIILLNLGLAIANLVKKPVRWK
jgi:cellulose synthase/poly-beta-1,6-N-acetylglucosamine synthase-like glycosyltransferase